MASLRERYDQALAEYRARFGTGLPPAVASLMRDPGRLGQVVLLLEAALRRHAPAEASEWHSLLTGWLRQKKRPQARRRGSDSGF